MPTYAVLAPYMSHPAVIEAGSPREAAAEFADRHDEVLKDGAHPTVREGARRVPAAAVKITERGKNALGPVNRSPENHDRDGQEPCP